MSSKPVSKVDRKVNWAGLFGSFLVITLIREASILGWFSYKRIDEPRYSSPDCLLKLVNTTAPQHYSAHPFYQGVTYTPNCDLQSYIDMQYATSEKPIFDNAMIAMGIVSTLAAFTVWQEILSIKFLIAVVMLWWLSASDMSYTHFGQDIVFLCGNIMHHSDISSFRDESNATFVAMIPQGFMFSSLTTFLWGYVVKSLASLAFPRLKRFISIRALAFATFLSIVFVAHRVKTNHPLMHSVATKDMANAYPWTFEWRAYRHVFVHHGNGDSFGPSMCFDWIFSSALYAYSYIHNDLLKLDISSNNHYLFAVAFDTLLGIFCALVHLLYMMLFERIYSTFASLLGFSSSELKTKKEA